MSRKADARETILEAAEAVVTEAGAAHLTLDKVAAKAAVSKGGLLYHFPSKEALLQGMINRCLQRVQADELKFKARLGPARGADLQAHVRAGFEERPEQSQVAAALLAAGAIEPKLLGPIRERHRRQYHELIQSKRHPMRAAAILMAIDGLWLNELLQTSPFNRKERKRLMNTLLELARSAA